MSTALYLIVILAAIAVTITIIVLLVRRHRRRQEETELARQQDEVNTLRSLIAQIEAGDADAYSKFKDPVPGTDYSWYSVARRTDNADSDAGMLDSLERTIDRYLTAQQHPRWAKEMAESAKLTAGDLTLTGRIRALTELIRVWVRLNKETQNWTQYRRNLIRDRLGNEFGTYDDLRAHLTKLVDQYATELATAAHAGSKEAFNTLYALRADARGMRTDNTDPEAGRLALFERVIDKPFRFPDYAVTRFEVAGWLELVDQHLVAPTLADLDAHPSHPLQTFASAAVTVLDTGSRLDAKRIQAYLVSSRAHREILPDGLRAAIHIYATTGSRPQLDLVYAAQPLPETA